MSGPECRHDGTKEHDTIIQYRVFAVPCLHGPFGHVSPRRVQRRRGRSTVRQEPVAVDALRLAAGVLASLVVLATLAARWSFRITKLILVYVSTGQKT